MEIKKTLNEIKSSQEKLRGEVFEKVGGYILGAFGLVVGLAWNEAIKSLIEFWFPLNRGGIIAQFIYALILTTLLVVFAMYMARMLKQKDS